jgi:hypothetical protein
VRRTSKKVTRGIYLERRKADTLVKRNQAVGGGAVANKGAGVTRKMVTGRLCCSGTDPASVSVEEGAVDGMSLSLLADFNSMTHQKRTSSATAHTSSPPRRRSSHQNMICSLGRFSRKVPWHVPRSELLRKITQPSLCFPPAYGIADFGRQAD